VNVFAGAASLPVNVTAEAMGPFAHALIYRSGCPPPQHAGSSAGGHRGPASSPN
jgi:hypothetical protein